MAKISARETFETSVVVTYTNPIDIASFNRGPLTTIFTQPESCLSTATSAQSVMYVGGYGWGDLYLDPSCFPTSTANIQSDWKLFYYSPAQCPLSWSHAKTFTSTFANPATTLSVGADTTAVLCCPPGYSYNGLGVVCWSTWSTATEFVYIAPSKDSFGNWAVATPKQLSIAGGKVDKYADGVPAFWQSSDLALFSQASATATQKTATTSSGSTSANITPTTSASSADVPPNTTASTGLSNGAKIGLGLGIPLALIAISCIAFFIWTRRRKQSISMQSASSIHQPTSYAQHDYSRQEVDAAIPTNQWKHAQQDYSRREMDNNGMILELPGYWRKSAQELDNSGTIKAELYSGHEHGALM